MEQNKLKSYEERTPALEAKVTVLEEGMKRTQQSLDEKTSALSTTRKHLKHARERNMVRWDSTCCSALCFIVSGSGPRVAKSYVLVCMFLW